MAWYFLKNILNIFPKKKNPSNKESWGPTVYHFIESIGIFKSNDTLIMCMSWAFVVTLEYGIFDIYKQKY